MKVPFHTNCREHWGCHPSCPVAALARYARDLEEKVAKLEAEAEKKQKGEPNE